MMATDDSPKLMKIKQKKWIGGVCAGIAYWLGWPAWMIRALTVALVIFAGSGVLAYIILWIFMPASEELPPDYEERTS